MTAKTIDWDILKHNGLFRTEGGAGSTARWPVLCCLIGYSNTRNRAWPTVATIMQDVGINDKTATSEAITWLEERGALYKVVREKREGKELALSARRNVYQLTGIVEIDGKIVTYFPMDQQAITDMIHEVQAVNGLWVWETTDDDNGLEPDPIKDGDGRDTPSIEDGNGRESRPSMVGNPDHQW